jgi:lysozyme
VQLTLDHKEDPMQREEFTDYCRQHLGKPYIWGANGPESFDCSGLAQTLLARIGLDPPGDQTANDLFRYFSAPEKGRPVGTAECGCLVFYGKPSRVGHVAICFDDKDMIEAGGGGPETTTVEIARQEHAEVRIRPITRRSDIVAIIRPHNLPWLAPSVATAAPLRVVPVPGAGKQLHNTIDISHWQTVSSYQDVRDAGIALVFHKATQGIKYVDEKYKENIAGFQAVGVACGAYHFGVGGDGSDQADHFLSVADPNSLLVLDLEVNPGGSSMTLEGAEEFVQYVKDVTGRYPGLYSGYRIREMLGNRTDTPLACCWLWTARYSAAPVIPRAWKKWTFWQYTDGKNGPGACLTGGIGLCDRDVFNGDEAEFKDFMASNTKAA